ncbi:MAG: hypothetical protein K8S20_09450 [Chloroflexi bacterium]|nr:hypothetical protein [Chloroflexota bacterium]
MNLLSNKASFILAALLFMTSACKANISRNGDGSLTVETTISQQELQEAITAAIADPLIQELNASLQSGYVLVTSTRQRLNDAAKTDSLSLRLDLGVSNGQLTSTISAAQIDGVAIEQNRVDLWNQTIANRLSLIGNKNQNSTLESISITPDQVTMTWKVVR